MTFTLEKAVEILQRTPHVLRSLLHDLSEDWTTPNEGEKTWSAYDVVGHLIHGEKTDWIPRAKIILSGTAGKTFEPFDRFAQFEVSKGWSLPQLLDEFQMLRAGNLEQLESLRLTAADLKRKGIHPSFGEVTLSQLLATWVVHDLNHIAQISRVMAKQYHGEVGPWVEFLRVLRG